MFDVVLYQPEIPPNTGNVIRLCANAGARLHLIEPLGFPIDHAKMRRAGLDYHEFTNVKEYDNFADFMLKARPERLFALTTKGSVNYTTVPFQKDDYFIFGPETRGLPKDILELNSITEKLRLPMKADSRSLNLSNTVAVMLFEALRQVGFGDLE
ncbi:MAG: tRNA (uridine(34)/cytosine(34)/5-carboxymethylaminomethyluridine(34)-2'-O)-methyltransferase TrmL [Xanthomonadales bacterium]|nr:tRNA (uridine(34)/cytosine(34)/5-carboxymethylaminomethyluridine(34)-2'-O)-methyltransferase TrmL [Xanthomonadales bacterium]